MSMHTHESKKKVALRYATWVAALVLVIQWSLPESPLRSFSLRTSENLASVVGMSVGVPPNETNMLAQEMQTKQQEINARERALDAREQDIRSTVADEVSKRERVIYLALFGVATILVLLIGANFYMDNKRKKRSGTPIANDPHAHEGEFTTKL